MNYLKIDNEDVCNGEGLRVVLWLSGCSHKCKGCQNPQTWNANSGIPFDETTKAELFKLLDKDYIAGLTLTGGDPLFEKSLDSILDLVNESCLLYPQKTIWIYTGFTWESIMEYESSDTDDFDYIEEAYTDGLYKTRKKIISKCDVLIDGRYIESQREINLKWRGSSNQRVIDIQESLKQNRVVLYCD